LDSIWDLFKPEELLRFGGKALLFLIVFLENGVFFGFFLPGDSLLFTAGLLCYLGVLDIELFNLITLIFFAAVGGYYAGYWFGNRTGNALYKRKESFFYKRKYIDVAENFYKKYGGITLIIGRFLPIVRTFAPILAGAVKVSARTFFFYNIIGAILWPSIVVTAGYYVGAVFPNALDYLDFIIVAFIIITTVPVMNSWFKDRKMRKQAMIKEETEKQIS